MCNTLSHYLVTGNDTSPSFGTETGIEDQCNAEFVLDTAKLDSEAPSEHTPLITERRFKSLQAVSPEGVSGQGAPFSQQTAWGLTLPAAPPSCLLPHWRLHRQVPASTHNQTYM